VKRIAELLLVAICMPAFALTCGAIFFTLLHGNSNGRRDFVCYWAAGQLLVRRQNPYDVPATLQTESAKGLPIENGAIMMRNPPMFLLLVLPLGFVSIAVGSWLWVAAQVGCLVASVRMLWVMHGRPRGHLNLLGYSFGPALCCLLLGQTSLFILLGLVLFLRFHHSHPFWSGVSLSMCALKPHLLIPFFAVLFFWIAIRKRYSILVGFLSTLVIGAGLTSVISPNVWRNYHQMMTTSGIGEEFIPCLSTVLRVSLSPHSIWPQYLLAAGGCVWAISYLWQRSNEWDWLEHGGPLILVSLLVVPYEWVTDLSIALPAVLSAAYACRSRLLIGALAVASAAIEIQMFSGQVSLHSKLYLWQAPAMLAWYLVVMRQQPESITMAYASDAESMPSL
jgi:hypothetical protein